MAHLSEELPGRALSCSRAKARVLKGCRAGELEGNEVEPWRLVGRCTMSLRSMTLDSACSDVSLVGIAFHLGSSVLRFVITAEGMLQRPCCHGAYCERCSQSAHPSDRLLPCIMKRNLFRTLAPLRPLNGPTLQVTLWGVNRTAYQHTILAWRLGDDTATEIPTS